MLNFPIELQLGVVKDLQLIDIFHLEMTCKSLYSFIEGSPSVWRQLLKEMCIREHIIWANYETLSTADEFKKACTGSIRFRQLYDKTGDGIFEILKCTRLPSPNTSLVVGSNGSGGSAQRIEVENAEDSTNASQASASPMIKQPWLGGLHDTYLVPGGRYVLTTERCILHVWDLGSAITTGAPVLLLRHATNLETFARFQVVQAVSHSKLRVLIHGNYSRLRRHAKTHVVLEIDFKRHELPFVRQLGAVDVQPADGESARLFDSQGLLQGDFVVITMPGVTVLWNYASNFYRVFRELSYSMHLRHFFLRNLVCYIDGHGLYAADLKGISSQTLSGAHHIIPIPPNEDIPCVNFALVSSHSDCVENWGGDHDEPKVFLPVLSPDDSCLTYDLAMWFDGDDFLPSGYDIYRFHFVLSPDNPFTNSNLEAQEHLHYPATGTLVPQERYMARDGSYSFVWGDEEGPNYFWGISMCHSGSKGTPQTDPPASPTISVLMQDDDEAVQHLSLCCSSGKLAILGDRFDDSEDDDGSKYFVYVYDFLA